MAGRAGEEGLILDVLKSPKGINELKQVKRVSLERKAQEMSLGRAKTVVSLELSLKEAAGRGRQKEEETSQAKAQS